MAETKADDEDDEWGFGDFTFASAVPNETNKINNSSNDYKEDDEWGDFVKSPLQSSASESLPVFSSSSDVNDVGGAGSEGKTQWVKLKGALPLSLFGEEEKDEESGVVDPSGGDGKNSFSDNLRTGNLKKDLNFHSGVGINGIIANLYNQNDQIRGKDKEMNLDLNGSKLDTNEMNSSVGVSNLDSVSGLKLEMYNNSQETKNENGLSSKSLSNGSSSNLGGLHMGFDGSSSNSSGVIPVSSGANLDMIDPVLDLSGLNWTSGNRNVDISTSRFNQEVKFKNGLIHNSNSNASNSNFGGTDLNFNGLNPNADTAANEDFDGDDDGWEFKDAYSESKVENGNDKHNVPLEFPAFQVQSEVKTAKEMQDLTEITKMPSELNDSRAHIDLFAMPNGDSGESHDKGIKCNDPMVQSSSISDPYLQSAQKDKTNGLNSHPLAQNAYSDDVFGKFDLFSMSNGVSNKSDDMDIGFKVQPKTEAQNGFTTELYQRSVEQDMKSEIDSHQLTQNADSEESFGDFAVAVTNTGLKQEEEPKVYGPHLSDGEVLTSNGKNQENEMKLENHNGPMPLSIFGEEESETDASLDIQNNFMPKPSPYSGNVHSQAPSLSINDILSDLYSQAEPTPSIGSTHKPPEIELESNVVPNSDLADVDDDFEDGSWEFMDALPQKTKDETILHKAEEVDRTFSSEKKITAFVDFYCKLKDELYLLSSFHLDRLKKDRGAVSLSGEVAKQAAIDEEIQDALMVIGQENIMNEGVDAEEHPHRELCLEEFLEALQDDMLQILDSEYELSRKLTLAEKDFNSTVELIKHATTMVKILTLVSTEDQSSYLSTWFKMFTVCDQELKHGAWIWKQCLERNVQSRIISEPQGKRFILALGEIYRVVGVLGASVKLYKPWILSSSVYCTSIFALSEECHNLWACSGLEEALKSISDLTSSEYYGTHETLLASINKIRGIDALALYHDFDRQEAVCLLSGLTSDLLPDMKMVVWDGENYFLTLANLWANLINYDPPKLPRIKVG